jgi:hypothetical protein
MTLRLAAITLAVLLVGTATATAQRYDRGRHQGYFDPSNFLGGVLGGVIGGVIVNRPQYYPPVYQPPQYDPIQYCMSRFRSYNPETGVYLGYDGRYRRCP